MAKRDTWDCWRNVPPEAVRQALAEIREASSTCEQVAGEPDANDAEPRSTK